MAKVIVIDDNAELLQMMDLILRDQGGHDVVLIADGREGLGHILAHPPDLAIVDVMMPGINGYEIVRQLRERPQTAHIPIIILTARGQPIDRQAALNAGADDHIVKPVSNQELLQKVDELLQAKTPQADGGRVVSLLSLRGGVGVTTCAVNLALTAARVSKGGVCLVDQSPASGQVALHLRVSAQQNWTALPDLTALPDDLLGLLTVHPSSLRVLAAPFEPIHANVLNAVLIERALLGLKSHCDFVVIDAPPLLNDAAAMALDCSDLILMVLTPEIGAIQSTLAMLKIMDELRDKVLLVLNHAGNLPGVPQPVIEKALAMPIAAQIPFDPAQMSALAQGKPLAWAQPNSPLALALKKLLAVVGKKLLS